jgi:hypothetical protein
VQCKKKCLRIPAVGNVARAVTEIVTGSQLEKPERMTSCRPFLQIWKQSGKEIFSHADCVILSFYRYIQRISLKKSRLFDTGEWIKMGIEPNTNYDVPIKYCSLMEQFHIKTNRYKHNRGVDNVRLNQLPNKLVT